MRVKRTGFGQRILNSFVALLIGIVLFFGSFVVLFINEGRENLAVIANEARPYETGEIYIESDLVYVQGSLSTTAPITDAYLKDGTYVRLIRIVEMYAYVEIENTRTRENIGGSQTTEYTYTYETRWVNDPRSSTTFKGDALEKPTDIPGNYNTWITQMPSERIETANQLTINEVPMSSAQLTISNPRALILSEDNVDETALLTNESIHDTAIFRQNSVLGTLQNPSIGDVRIYYRVVTDEDEGLLLASIPATTFVRYVTPDDNTLFRFFTGVTTIEDAVDILQAEYTASLWILRLVGFLMMFFGMLLIANPARTLLSVLPIFAKIGMFIYGVFAFVTSLVLSTLVIVISMIFHNTLLAILVVLIIVIVAIVYLRSKKGQRQATRKPK